MHAGDGAAVSGSLVTVDEVNRFFGAEFPGPSTRSCVELGPGWAVAELPAEEAGLRPGGIISGPSVFSLCDAAFYMACFTVTGIEPMVMTSEMSIRFLRPARGRRLLARADVLDVRGRSIVATVRAWDAAYDEPVALCQGTYVRPRRPDRSD
jgi:uncharacterized protein (TIGR00369 family)